MRFLFVANTERDPTQGAPSCDLATIEALRRLGHEVDEIWGTDMPHRITHPNLHQLLELPGNFARAVETQCAKKDYDVIQVNQPHAYLAAMRHRQLARPGVFVNRSHGWEPAGREIIARYSSLFTGTSPRPAWRQLASRVMAHYIERHNKRVVKWTDGVVVCSIDDREYVIERHQAEAARVLSLAPGIPTDFFMPLPDEAPDRWKRLLYIGNFCSPKAPEVVAQIFRNVIDSNSECQATWVCPSEFHAKARSLVGPSASEAITFLDWMPRQQLISLLDQHGLLLYPSHYEGFPLTFLQAMARGLCVLATNISGMRQVIRDECDGYLFPRRAADLFADKVANLLANPQECHRVSAEARRTALKFTWERTAREYIEFCERLISLKRSS
jgi:glycosyltransferase involved in cell wall biosynthesis